MTQCTEAEVQRLLPWVSQQRREGALRFKHLFGQYACLKSYELLHQMLVHEGHIAETDKPEFDIDEHGKPTLHGLPQVHFNLSHCKNALAAVVSDTPVGIDVERFVQSKPSLVRYTMSDLEQQQIASSSNPDRQFALLWTQKEALLKCRGTGITSDLKTILADLQGIRLTSWTDDQKSYAATIAALS